MKTCHLSAFFVSLLISAADLQTFRVLVTKSEVSAVVGDAAILSVRPSSPVVSGFWKFRSSSIVTWTVEPPYLNVAYNKRNVQLLMNTSLLVLSVTLADSGVYRVTMDSPSGQEATANVTLNVFPKPVPFTISAESKEINATVGDTIRLKVTPSEEVKNGSWQVGGKVVARWKDEVVEINTDYQERAALFDQTSLQLKSANTSDTGEYSVTMSTGYGDTKTARIQLNIFRESQPLEVSAELSNINAEIGADVLISVRVRGEVKNGTWCFDYWDIFTWSNTVENTTKHDYVDIELLPNTSLHLRSVNDDWVGMFTISLMSPMGVTAMTNITMNVFTSRRTCTVYNSVLAMLILLLLTCILIFAIYVHKKRPKDYLETFDLPVIFCKGYRTCLSLLTVVTFSFVIIFGVTIHRNLCAPGQRPVLNFLAD